MRREDREITDPAEIECILNEALVCRIGLADGGEPYVVPVSFGYENGPVYIHSAMAGKKIAMMAKNPRCCFEVDICDRVIRGDRPCSWGMRYRSVIGNGMAVILTDPKEKTHGLNCIVQHYGGGIHEFSESDIRSVTVIRIAVESMTGKKHI
jgi:hypothetical protein